MKGNQVLGYNLCSKQWNKLFGRINVKKGCLLFKHNHNTRIPVAIFIKSHHHQLHVTSNTWFTSYCKTKW